MTVKYTYKCFSCGHTYIEQRAAEESPFFTKCNLCNTGDYEETSVEVISETVERAAGPVIVIEEQPVEPVAEIAAPAADPAAPTA
jgi:peptide subunit release factor 1 (eRF1)